MKARLLLMSGKCMWNCWRAIAIALLILITVQPSEAELQKKLLIGTLDKLVTASEYKRLWGKYELKHALETVCISQAAAEATIQISELEATSGVSGVAKGNAWAYAMAATSGGLNVDTMIATEPGAGAMASTQSTGWWPPGHASALARVDPAAVTQQNPKANAIGFAAARAAMGFGTSRWTDGDSMEGMIRFVLANIIVDPLWFPPDHGADNDPVLGTMIDEPAELNITGGVFFNNDPNQVTELFRIGVSLTTDIMTGQMSLGLIDTTGILSPTDFEFFKTEEGSGYMLSSPVSIAVPFSITHDYPEDTPFTLYLDSDVIARSVAPVPEPSTLALIGFGVAGILIIRKRN